MLPPFLGELEWWDHGLCPSSFFDLLGRPGHCLHVCEHLEKLLPRFGDHEATVEADLFRSHSVHCEQGHGNESGNPFLCDRLLVKRCVNVWFGSREAFEETVRSEVLDIVSTDLTQGVFTTKWVLGVTVPILPHCLCARIIALSRLELFLEWLGHLADSPCNHRLGSHCLQYYSWCAPQSLPGHHEEFCDHTICCSFSSRNHWILSSNVIISVSRQQT